MLHFIILIIYKSVAEKGFPTDKELVANFSCIISVLLNVLFTNEVHNLY